MRLGRAGWIGFVFGALVGLLPVAAMEGGKVFATLATMLAPVAAVCQFLFLLLFRGLVLIDTGGIHWGWFSLVIALGCLANAVLWAAIVKALLWTRQRHRTLFFIMVIAMALYWGGVLATLVVSM